MATIKGYNMPDELYYHKEHTWVRLEDDGTTGKIQSSKWVGKLIAPISGEIVEINEDLEDDFMMINNDPYGDGWIMKIEPSDLDDALQNLIHGEDAVLEFLEKEQQAIDEGNK